MSDNFLEYFFVSFCSYSWLIHSRSMHGFPYSGPFLPGDIACLLTRGSSVLELVTNIATCGVFSRKGIKNFVLLLD